MNALVGSNLNSFAATLSFDEMDGLGPCPRRGAALSSVWLTSEAAQGLLSTERERSWLADKSLI
jgi:hypothetical protein